MKKLKFSLLVLLFAISDVAFSQNDKINPAYIHFDNTNILFRGIDNPILISSQIGGEYTISSKAPVKILKDEFGYKVNPINVKEDSLILDVTSQKNVKLKESVKFKVMDVPVPVIKFGAINLGLDLNRAAVRLQPQLSAVIENFIIDGIRYKVNSYTFNYVDYSKGIAKIKSIKVEGSSLEKISDILKNIGAGEKMEITDIKVTSPSGNLTINNIVFSLK